MRLGFARHSSGIGTRSIRRSAPLPVALLTLTLAAPAASAKKVTLRYFSKHTSTTFVNPQGLPLGPNSSPAVGEISDDTGIDFVGNHKHHARKATASDHLRCTITNFTAIAGTATCDGRGM